MLSEIDIRETLSSNVFKMNMYFIHFSSKGPYQFIVFVMATSTCIFYLAISVRQCVKFKKNMLMEVETSMCLNANINLVLQLYLAWCHFQWNTCLRNRGSSNQKQSVSISWRNYYIDSLNVFEVIDRIEQLTTVPLNFGVYHLHLWKQSN